MQKQRAIERSWLLVAGITAASLMLLAPAPDGLSEAGKQAAILGALMAFLWVTETIPLAATALIPLAAFPLAGVETLETTAQSYSHPLIILFLGGFMLGAAMERWQLHHRLALLAISVSGRSPTMLVLGMMSATAFLSLWVSNTATAMVMVPIAASLVASGRGDTGAHAGDQFAPALMLGVAFAATIGGMGSLIGTPPNALFAGFVEKSYGVTVGFAQWMVIGIPIVLVLLPLTWLILTRFVFRLSKEEIPASALPPEPGPMTRPERMVAAVLVLVALTWVVRPILAEALGFAALTDAGVAITGVLALFLMPARWRGDRGLITWDEVKAIRWDVLILFGGGLALAGAIASTGLATWIGESMSGLRHIPIMLLVLAMMIVIVYLGELASNTAVAAVFLPVAGAAAAGLGADPLALLLPVALAASLGFMLPVATPPNAIVYGTGAVTARQMLKAGALLDVVSILIVFALALLLGPFVLAR
jgi:sodium-dependent dicarboxylate transporter 2/3/5